MPLLDELKSEQIILVSHEKELEPELAIYDQTKNRLEIKRLKQDVESIEELREEVRKLREDRAKHDKKIVEHLMKKGILPKNLSFFN